MGLTLKLRDGETVTATIRSATEFPNSDTGTVMLCLHAEVSTWPGTVKTIYCPSSAGRDLLAAGAHRYLSRDKLGVFDLDGAPKRWRIRRTTRNAVRLFPLTSDGAGV